MYCAKVMIFSHINETAQSAKSYIHYLEVLAYVDDNLSKYITNLISSYWLKSENDEQIVPAKCLFVTAMCIKR